MFGLDLNLPSLNVRLTITPVILTNGADCKDSKLVLTLTNNLFNFIETMSWVFAIEVSIFGCENRVVEKVFGRLCKFVQF